MAESRVFPANLCRPAKALALHYRNRNFATTMSDRTVYLCDPRSPGE